MNKTIARLASQTCLGIAALAASVLLAGRVQAANTVPIKVTVNTAGLDLSQEAGIRALYSRLKNAADAVCNNLYRVGLQPVPDYANCYEQALGAAIQSVNQPQLTQVYLGAHSLKDATAHGVKVPLLAAAAQPRH